MKISKYVLLAVILLSLTAMILTVSKYINIGISLKYEVQDPQIIFGKNEYLLNKGREIKLTMWIYRVLILLSTSFFIGSLCIFFRKWKANK
jgi:hypothetical protein